MMESEGKMTTTDARGWINALIKAMHEETSGSWPDPEYKDEVYSALEMAIQALSQEPCDDAISLTKEAYSDLCLRASKADDLQRALDMEKGAYNALVKNIQCEDAISRDNEFFNFDAPMVKKSMEQDAISREDRLIDLANAIESDDSDYWTNKRISSALRNISSVTQKSETYVDGIHAICYREGYKDAQKQKSGKWINDKNDIPICSRCGYIPQYDRAIDDYEYSNYCPNCGACMKEARTLDEFIEDSKESEE